MPKSSPHVEISMRMQTVVIALCLVSTGCAAPPRGSGAADDIAAVRVELERLYAINNAAYMRGDIEGVMALRAPDYHTLTPDGRENDRAAMRSYVQNNMNAVRKWNRISITIDSLTVSGDTAYAQVSQHLDREVLRPDQTSHHVQTWAKQREIWIRSGSSWLMWRVDQVRDLRRVVDGRPG